MGGRSAPRWPQPRSFRPRRPFARRRAGPRSEGTQGSQPIRVTHPGGHATGPSAQRFTASLAYQVDRYDARHLCLEAGVAYMVVVGEDGACRCPFGVRRQERVGRLAGTAELPPRHDKTHQLANPREHLFPQLARFGARVSLRVWQNKATDRRTPPAVVATEGVRLPQSRALAPEEALTSRQPLRQRTAACSAGRG
jgi:hypothetical protein